jgi:hypothetical protein
MSNTPSHEEIEVRAYEIFLERGGEHGRDVEDWIAAERELNSGKEQTKAVSTREMPQIEVEQATYAVASSGRGR